MGNMAKQQTMEQPRTGRKVEAKRVLSIVEEPSWKQDVLNTVHADVCANGLFSTASLAEEFDREFADEIIKVLDEVFTAGVRSISVCNQSTQGDRHLGQLERDSILLNIKGHTGTLELVKTGTEYSAFMYRKNIVYH